MTVPFSKVTFKEILAGKPIVYIRTSEEGSYTRLLFKLWGWKRNALKTFAMDLFTELVNLLVENDFDDFLELYASADSVLIIFDFEVFSGLATTELFGEEDGDDDILDDLLARRVAAGKKTVLLERSDQEKGYSKKLTAILSSVDTTVFDVE